MNKCQFSETQFSFCFTFEYLKRFIPNIPLPIFPNTVQEGRSGGYDVGINGNVYFQFKIPTFHDTFSNFYRRYWDTFGHEYFKIYLKTDENQYRLLKRLDSGMNAVFYATPEFYSQSDLAIHYTNDGIVRNSSLFSLQNLPPVNSGYHHLIYSPTKTWGKLFSEPRRIEKINSINPFKLFPEEKKGFSLLEQANYLRSILIENEGLSENSRSLLESNKNQLVLKVYTVLLTEFDLHWYPVISQNGFR